MSCIEGHEKKDASSGSYACESNGNWSGKETICVPQDCGAPLQVVKRRNILGAWRGVGQKLCAIVPPRVFSLKLLPLAS